MNSYREAIGDYDRAIAKDRKYADAYYSRGMLKLTLNQNDSGCNDLNTALKLGNKDAYDAFKKNCR